MLRCVPVVSEVGVGNSGLLLGILGCFGNRLMSLYAEGPKKESPCVTVVKMEEITQRREILTAAPPGKVDCLGPTLRCVWGVGGLGRGVGGLRF